MQGCGVEYRGLNNDQYYCMITVDGSSNGAEMILVIIKAHVVEAQDLGFRDFRASSGIPRDGGTSAQLEISKFVDLPSAGAIRVVQDVLFGFGVRLTTLAHLFPRP